MVTLCGRIIEHQECSECCLFIAFPYTQSPNSSIGNDKYEAWGEKKKTSAHTRPSGASDWVSRKPTLSLLMCKVFIKERKRRKEAEAGRAEVEREDRPQTALLTTGGSALGWALQSRPEWGWKLGAHTPASISPGPSERAELGDRWLSSAAVTSEEAESRRLCTAAPKTEARRP